MKANEFWEKLSIELDLPFDIEDVTSVEENCGSTHIETTKGTFFVMVEKCEEEEKKFLCVDMSGRGGHAPYSFSELKEMDQKRINEMDADEKPEDEDTLTYWAEFAEVGQEFIEHSQKFIRVN